MCVARLICKTNFHKVCFTLTSLARCHHQLLADTVILSERILHRASSLPQSPINLPVKQILGLSGAPICVTQMRGYVRSVKSTATILSRARHDAATNTSAPHFIVKNSPRIVEERDLYSSRAVVWRISLLRESRINLSQKSRRVLVHWPFSRFLEL